MKLFFHKFGRNILDSFKGYNFLFHLLAILLTYLLVVSNFDWKYYSYLRGSYIYYFAFAAAAVGAIIPFIAPSCAFIFGKIQKDKKLFNAGFALTQSAMLGLFISSFYKMLTGRAHPEIIQTFSDVTHIFKFGLMRGGIFWGWPSSHTAVAFAMAFSLWVMYPKNKITKTFALIYALFVGLGVSMTVHWFSDFVAGAIIGAVIGTVVGKSFKNIKS